MNIRDPFCNDNERDDGVKSSVQQQAQKNTPTEGRAKHDWRSNGPMRMRQWPETPNEKRFKINGRVSF